MLHRTSLKKLPAVSLAVLSLSLGATGAQGQDQDLSRVNQDELASFYGRMNVVVGSGARAFGMGGAFLARADDATAASWNPAGLSYLRRTEASVVGVNNRFSQRIPRLNTAVSPSQPVTTTDQLEGSVADFMGVAYPLRIKRRTGAIQASFQRSFSFTGNRQSEGSAGRGPEFTVEGSGGFDTLSLSSGFEVHPGVRLGVSVNRWINGFSQSVHRTSQTATGAERTIDSTWDISGTNFNFGALYTPTPSLNLGAVFKTPFEASVNLYKKRTDRQSSPEGAIRIPDQTNDNQGNVRIRFPRVYGLGASYRFTNTITVSADFTRTAWSQANISNFFSLAKANSEGDFLDNYTVKLPFPAVEEGSNGQQDTDQIRVGAEYVLRLGASGNTLLPIRAGFFRDGQPVAIRLAPPPGFPYPVATPSFPGFTAGVGITLGGVLLDLAYIREAGNVPATRGIDNVADGSVRSVQYNRVFASMIVRFGPRR